MRWLLAITLLLSLSLARADITAQSWVIADENLNIQAGNNFLEVRSMASLTKLLTVMVALDDHSHSHRLIKLAMVRSNNQAADRLCRLHSQGYAGCIAAMNAKARWIGALDTRVVDATGIRADNRSTALDLARIIRAASHYPEIVAASTINDIQVGRRKTAHNTNPLVVQYPTVVSKTGWTKHAGGCLAMMVGDKILVLMGSKNTRTRITEMQQLIASIPVA